MSPNDLLKIVFLLFLLFATPATSRAFAYFAKTIALPDNKISTIIPTYDTATPQKTATLVCEMINQANWWGLYEISATEIKSTFTRDDFVTAFSTSNLLSCETVSPISYLSGSWAKATIVAKNGETTNTYTLALKKETDTWKMFGTTGGE